MADPTTAAGRALLNLVREVEVYGVTDRAHRGFDLAWKVRDGIATIEAEAAAPYRDALEHARKYANRIYERREWSESDLLEIIHAADDALLRREVGE